MRNYGTALPKVFLGYQLVKSASEEVRTQKDHTTSTPSTLHRRELSVDKDLESSPDQRGFSSIIMDPYTQQALLTAKLLGITFGLSSTGITETHCVCERQRHREGVTEIRGQPPSVSPCLRSCLKQGLAISYCCVSQASWPASVSRFPCSHFPSPDRGSLGLELHVPPLSGFPLPTQLALHPTSPIFNFTHSPKTSSRTSLPSMWLTSCFHKQQKQTRGAAGVAGVFHHLL